MEDLLAFGRQAMASQPFSVLLGAELLHFSQVETRVSGLHYSQVSSLKKLALP